MGEHFNIVELFLRASEQSPFRIAIVDKSGIKISYSQLKNSVEQTAFYFKNKGIKKGDRVLVFVSMSIDMYRVVLALFYIGATAVFLDEWTGKKRLEQCCRIADCQAFIGVWKARILGLLLKEIRKISIRTGLKYTRSIGDNMSYEAMSPGDIALITFTTGSTGTPKAASRTHEFLKAQFDVLIKEINPAEDDVSLCTLPIVLFCNLGMGTTSVIPDYSAFKA